MPIFKFTRRDVWESPRQSPSAIDGVTTSRHAVGCDDTDPDAPDSLGYDYFHDRHRSVETHAKKHEEMYANMQRLGWFWGSIKMMIKVNAATTIGEAIEE
jgi:hypothetical protein